ncbi:hypothetical protein H2201_006023 [Coniosporium apollinis]|uniref:RCC1/BLIP-II protein n=2 Tax=Coniosporium TaxID=2810619 RepID=A0ABQ9NTC2_9PEZI|nr:hypothetical protein H2199_002946 [Cladosporium sp. JES 115]KAJ9662535.1 hypothetical protein H2201_006023 [Coniosporium apollinis]
MELHACGFNGHIQLATNAELPDRPSDVYAFTKIASDHRTGVAYAGWSQTLVNQNTSLLGRGHNLRLDIPLWDGPPLSSFFGTHDGVVGALGANGELYRFSHDSDPAFTLQGDEGSPRLAHVATNNADRLAIIFLASPAANLMHVLEFGSVNEFLEWYSDPSADPPANVSRRHFMVPGRAKQLVAFATGFVLLTENGEVYTWGDVRHDRCLGRSVDAADNPADEPRLVEALAGIPIAKVAASGWICAALSKERDLYIWGLGTPGSEGRKIEVLNNVSPSSPHSKESGILYDLVEEHSTDSAEQDEDVTLVELESGLDVIDVGVGAGHVIVCAEGGRIFTVGDNDNGQLGLGKDARSFYRDWTEVKGFRGKSVESVTCGPRSSFVLVR